MACYHPPQPDDLFTIRQSEMDWFRLPFWESIFSLTNGLIGTRGSFEEPMDGTPSRPMTFMAGLYNTLPDGLPELPVLPDWLTTRITLNHAPYDMRLGTMPSFTRYVDMQRGLLHRDITWRDLDGHTTGLTFTRFVSLANRNLACLRISITPLDWSGPIEFQGLITMPPRPVAGKASHWELADFRSFSPGLTTLTTRTTQTDRPLAVSAMFHVDAGGQPSAPEAVATSDGVGQGHVFSAEQGCTYTFDRFVIFRTGPAQSDPPTEQARQTAIDAGRIGFDMQLDAHAEACCGIWERMDVQIDGPPEDQRAIRYSLFQLATLCPAPGDIASIGPKGLTGSGYLGHIFWDTEIYMVPFFSLTHPPGARTLLEYRRATLNGARRKAATSGYRGARFAWESADTGEEACPRFLPDPYGGPPIRIWCGDLQDHITADVPFAIDYYVKATGDRHILWEFGAEILLETARFWASKVTPTRDGTFVIRDVMGPDEFHIHVDNDAMTNYLAKWNLLAAADLYESDAFSNDRHWRKALKKRIGLRPKEPQKWREIGENLYLPLDVETGLIEEHDGFFDRPDISPDIFRLDRRGPITDIMGPRLAVEGQVLKQAEVVLLQAMMPKQFDQSSKEANFDYYEPRTSHDSSLSASAHAWAAARLDRLDVAYDYLKRAMNIDLDDLCGNTAHGLHIANMGGIWLAIAFGFAGLDIDGPKPLVSPRLPETWTRLRFPIQHRGRHYTIECTHEGATITPQ